MKQVWIIVATLVILKVCATLALAYDFKEQMYEKPLHIDKNHNFRIQSGDNLITIIAELRSAQILESYRGIIPLHWYAKLYAYLNETKPQKIQAGEYLLEADMKFHQFLDKALSGQVIQRKFTIIEGHTLNQILAAMKATPDINLSTTDHRDISRRLGIPQPSPEGWIFPDTYYYTADTDAIDLLAQGYRKMQTVLEELWQSRDGSIPLTSSYEALILASIVEKETAEIEERPKVAGVFIARLLKNMLLQADPTIIYGLGSSFDGNLRSRDLKEDQPYNSYIHRGLPPTPIAMPSLSSIAATLQPQFGDYLYFVAKGDGSHHFSKTYAEHLKAVNKYQLKR